MSIFHKIKRTNKQEVFRAGKFVLFSASAGIIEILAFTLLNELCTWPYWPSYLIALTLSVLWNFSFNRHFTFRSAKDVPTAMFLVFLYYLVFTPVTTIGGEWMTGTLGWNEYLVTAINMILNLVTEFLYQRYVVYGKDVDQR